MKKILTLITLLIAFSGLSQELTRQRGRFYANGEQISTRQVKTILSSNPEALALFKKAKGKESTGGFLIGLGGALVIADVVVGLVSDVQYPTAATYVGVGALVISIPVLSGKNKKTDQALELYNKGEKKLGANYPDVQLNVIANQNGYGLQFRF